jgi:hypothetical protein
MNDVEEEAEEKKNITKIDKHIATSYSQKQ